MQPYGQSGTIYDPPPVQSFIYAVGSPDLNQPMGGGFQAAHAWINNQSNQNLYLPGAPDVVPPGVTRVVALAVGDVAQASWAIPAVFGIVQPPAPTGAAIIIFLNAGVDIAPHPGVANNPIVSVASGNVTVSGQVTIGAGANVIGAISAVQSTVIVAGAVTISNTPSVTISGTPTVNIGNTPAVTVNSGTINIGNTPSVTISGTPTVILGGGTASIGSISAIGSTVTVAGTINIGNTPAVTISGTPNVNISSGTVSITGTPNINIQSQSVDVAVQLPWRAVGSASANGAGSFTTSAVAAGALSLGILISGSQGLSGLKVVGGTTGAVYEAVTTSVGPGASNVATGLITIPIVAAADTTYTISWTGTFGAGGAFTVSAFASGLTLGYPSLGQESMAASVPVVIASDQTVPVNDKTSYIQSALFRVPNKQPINLGNTLAAGATVVVVAAVANQFVYVFGVVVNLDAVPTGASALTLQDTAATALHSFSELSTAPFPLQGYGVQLGISLGVQFKNGATGSVTFRGSLVVSQG